jgi:hypothetical protein
MANSFEPLSNPHLISNASTTSQHWDAKRDYRYERRQQVQTITRRQRLKRCGNVALGPIEIGTRGKLAYFRNLETCGNVWLCSVCSAKVLTKRKSEIRESIAKWTSMAKPFIFQTLTMSHDSTMDFESVRDAAFQAFAKTNTGRFAQIHKDFGQEGYLKVAEVTVGENGWHLHFHVLRFIDHWLSNDEVQSWHALVFEKWSKSLTDMGLKAPQSKYQDFQQLVVAEDLDGYFTKAFDNPREMLDEILDTKHRTKTPWELIGPAVANAASKERRLWHDFENGSRGMRQITWARGFRQKIGMVDARTDEEVAADDELEFQALLVISSRDAPRIGAMGRVASRVLSLTERGDLLGACSLLAEHGIHPTLTDAAVDLIHGASDPPSLLRGRL